VIIVQGRLVIRGSGNRVFGGIMASNADLDPQSLTGGSVVVRSSCAVERAILGSPMLTRVRPLPLRSWVELPPRPEP